MRNVFFAGSLSFFILCGGAALAQASPTLLGALPASGPQPCGTYSGRVVTNEKPLAGVSIFVKGTNILLITNEEGFFTVPTQVTQFPTLLVSAAGYAPQELTFTSCIPVNLEMQLLPGTRIKHHGKRKGFIMKTGS